MHLGFYEPTNRIVTSRVHVDNCFADRDHFLNQRQHAKRRNTTWLTIPGFPNDYRNNNTRFDSLYEQCNAANNLHPHKHRSHAVYVSLNHAEGGDIGLFHGASGLSPVKLIARRMLVFTANKENPYFISQVKERKYLFVMWLQRKS